MSVERVIEVDGHELELSSLEKVLFPDSGVTKGDRVTKGDVIDYYRRIARVMLPHIKDHPVTMQRFPDGIDAKGFYHKQMPDYFPEWIESAKVEVLESGEIQDEVLPNNAATLVYLANQYTITLHIWLSRVDRLYYPDRMIFDLDPPGEFEVRTLDRLSGQGALGGGGTCAVRDDDGLARATCGDALGPVGSLRRDARFCEGPGATARGQASGHADDRDAQGRAGGTLVPGLCAQRLWRDGRGAVFAAAAARCAGRDTVKLG